MRGQASTAHQAVSKSPPPLPQFRLRCASYRILPGVDAYYAGAMAFAESSDGGQCFACTQFQHYEALRAAEPARESVQLPF
jgi:hypothetical protein